MPKKKIIVSVSNDLSNDQRIHRVCSSLIKLGYDVTLTGRKQSKSPQIEREYKTKRFRLLFNKGIFFYLCLNTRLFWYYIFNSFDVLLANDLDTLAAAGLTKIIKRKKLIYDSHELFTEVPELENKNFKKNIWLKIEKTFIRKADKSYTVCQSIADHYNTLYGIKMQVIRNLPISSPFPDDYTTRTSTLIYQGALNKDRGIEIMIEAMQFISGFKLIIAGKGDLEKKLKVLSKELKLDDRIKFTGNLNFEDLRQYTKTTKLGFSLEQGKSLNYKYSLPNKIFDYIQAGVPVVCSNYPEMSRIVNDFKLGLPINVKTGKELAEIINNLLSKPEQLLDFHNNCKIAAKELNWENEEKLLKDIFVI
jgi:glycosyltransferase involved in cell wall biosynthesis